LETELKTTTEALKDANTAKVSADKAAKAAETKAKKAEKALAKATDVYTRFYPCRQCWASKCRGL
jgi:hypothetical protein